MTNIVVFSLVHRETIPFNYFCRSLFFTSNSVCLSLLTRMKILSFQSNIELLNRMQLLRGMTFTKGMLLVSIKCHFDVLSCLEIIQSLNHRTLFSSSCSLMTVSQGLSKPWRGIRITVTAGQVRAQQYTYTTISKPL